MCIFRFIVLAWLTVFVGTATYAQNITVTGTVYDVVTGDPIISANVLVQGTTQATITDFNGRFTISNVSPTAFLVVSMVGFENKPIPVDGRTSVSIPMYPSGYDFSTYYSRQTGNWDDMYTWSYVDHNGPPAYELPGSTGCNVIIGAGHTVALTSNIDIAACQLTIQAGSTFDMNNFALHLGGDFNIFGEVLNGGEILVTFCQLQIYSAGTIPAFTRLVINNIGCTVTLGTDIVLQNGVQVVNGTFDDGGYTIYPCLPPDTPASGAAFANHIGTSMTLRWVRGNGSGGVLVVARELGVAQQKPVPGTTYVANAAFGNGDATGTGNYVVYQGTSTLVTITNLKPLTDYEFGIYEYNGSACYNISSFLGAADNTGCADPGAPTNPVNGLYCTGDAPATVSVDPAPGGYVIQWYTAGTGGSFPAGATTSGTTGEQLTPAAPGTYYAAIEDPATACGSTARTAVTLTEVPLATASPATQTICSGEQAAIALSGATSYNWTVTSGITGAAAGSTSAAAINQTLTNTTNTQQRVVYTITPSTGCPVTPLSIEVLVNPLPQAFDVSGGGDFCTGTTGVDVTVSGSQSGIRYELWINDVDIIRAQDGTGSALTFSDVNRAAFYTVYGFTDVFCQTKMNGSVVVTEVFPPSGTGSITGRTGVCVGREETYQATGLTGTIDTYHWTLPSGMEVLSQANNAATLAVLAGSGGTLSVTGENQCGTGGKATLSVNMLTPPPVSVILPEEPYAAEAVPFAYESTATIQAQAWTFGDGGTATTAAPDYVYAAGGTYTVGVLVTDDRGCQNDAEATLTVRPPATLADESIKNLVTANGDAVNGYLYIEDIHKFPDNEVMVLDRWGITVFKRTGYQNDWDFTRQGAFLPAGNYICIVRLPETGQVFTRTVSVIK